MPSEGRQADDARTRLIAGTRELLWERGYAATSPRAILDRTGVGQGSMYHHFAGKEDLAAAAFAESAELTAGLAEEVLSGPGTAVDRIRRYLLRHRDVLRGCPVGRMAEEADVLASEQLNAVLHNTFQRLRDQVRGVLLEGRSAGELPATLDADDVADTVLAVVQGGYVLARADGTPLPFHRAVNGAAAMIEMAVHPGEFPAAGSRHADPAHRPDNPRSEK
jgi:AcrR family transcriptional regulator